jgi:hypothetical protein
MPDVDKYSNSLSIRIFALYITLKLNYETT